jgi:hypothetical protein
VIREFGDFISDENGIVKFSQEDHIASLYGELQLVCSYFNDEFRMGDILLSSGREMDVALFPPSRMAERSSVVVEVVEEREKIIVERVARIIVESVARIKSNHI